MQRRRGREGGAMQRRRGREGGAMQRRWVMLRRQDNVEMER